MATSILGIPNDEAAHWIYMIFDSSPKSTYILA